MPGDFDISRQKCVVVQVEFVKAALLQSRLIFAIYVIFVRFYMLITQGTRLGRYEVRSLLGRGGMGEVYLARDTQLKRQAAIKVLPMSLTKDRTGLQRFEQEAYAASSLNHPNILTIYEIGEEEGVPFIAMEYIVGESLRQRKTRTSLDLIEVLNIAQQVASALSTAHNEGIVHRDIKPENLMLRPDGFVKVLDFGLAKLNETERLVDPDAATKAKVTEAGVVLGTANYMSPEQTRGLTLDGRTDIWSLGVVIYELVTGCLPFSGQTTSDVIASILTTEPPPLNTNTEGLPEELDRILNKTLRKNKQERYQLANELAFDLQSLRQLLMFAELQKTGARQLGTTTTEHPIKSIAVLPFKPLISINRDESLELGMADTLITRLGSLRTLVVRPTTAVRKYSALDQDPVIAGKELSADAVLDGSIQRAGNKIRITVRLLSVADGTTLWSDRFDDRYDDIFAIQDSISNKVVSTLAVTLRREESQQLNKRYTNNADAYEAYLKGRYYWNKGTPDTLAKAVQHFQEAVALDPNYALAYSALADGYNMMGYWGVASPGEAFPKAKKAAQRSVDLDATLGEAHAALAYAYFEYYWDEKTAEIKYKLALELNPNYASAHQWYAEYLLITSRFEEAAKELERAREIDPLSQHLRIITAALPYVNRRYDETISQLRKVLELDPTVEVAYSWLASCYAKKGMHDEVVTIVERQLSISGEDPNVIADLRRTYDEMGVASFWRRHAQLLQSKSTQSYIPPIRIAIDYAMCGEADSVFEWLEKAYAERSGWLLELKIDPTWDAYRSDPRFTALLERMQSVTEF